METLDVVSSKRIKLVCQRDDINLTYKNDN